jgi:hypothetical protein
MGSGACRPAAGLAKLTPRPDQPRSCPFQGAAAAVATPPSWPEFGVDPLSWTVVGWAAMRPAVTASRCMPANIAVAVPLTSVGPQRATQRSRWLPW